MKKNHRSKSRENIPLRPKWVLNGNVLLINFLFRWHLVTDIKLITQDKLEINGHFELKNRNFAKNPGKTGFTTTVEDSMLLLSNSSSWVLVPILE
jgi:hypothetical protein